MFCKCKHCFKKEITSNNFDKKANVSYKKWVKRKEKRNITGSTKVINLIYKETIETSMLEMVSEFKEAAPKFIIHLENFIHQAKRLINMKSNIGEKKKLSSFMFI